MFVREKFLLDPQKYVGEIEKKVEENPKDIDLLVDLAEARFELGEADKALVILQTIFSIDKQANDNFKVFLWAGQIFGGRNGIAFYDHALNLLKKMHDKKEIDEDEMKMQVSQALLAMIEIWMTDLCMEPEAEKSCEELIGRALITNEKDPEVWSILGSIRLSQMRNEEAKEALSRSWALFLQALEEGTVNHDVIPKLIRLAQSMVETMQIEEMMQVTAAIQALDDMVPEIYYLNTLGHNMLLNKSMDPLEASIHIACANEAADALVKLSEDETNPDPVEPLLLEAVMKIKEDLPKPQYEDPWSVLEQQNKEQEENNEQE